MGPYKAIIGLRLRARSFSGQQAEAAAGVAVLNRMLDVGHPDSVRRLSPPSQHCCVIHLGHEKSRQRLDPCNNAENS